MFRKFAAALVALVIAFGAVFAEEVKGTFVKFADLFAPQSFTNLRQG